MNNRQISEQAGVDQDVYTWNEIQLERFAKLIRADEREACAKLCEELHEKDTTSNYFLYAANKIRERSTT